MSQSDFDLRKANESFKKSLTDAESDVELDAYIGGYRELVKFFELLGRVFYFVVSDVRSKLDVLQQHRAGPHGNQYVTVRAMIRHEGRRGMLGQHGTATADKDTDNTDNGADVTDCSLPNGCRTLLRLHRALTFTSDLLTQIQVTPDDAGLSAPARAAYARTLAQHHPWTMRSLVNLALRALPARGAVLRQLNLAQQEPEVIQRTLQEAVVTMTTVYDVTQALYAEAGLLALP